MKFIFEEYIKSVVGLSWDKDELESDIKAVFLFIILNSLLNSQSFFTKGFLFQMLR